MTDLVLRKVRSGRVVKLERVPVVGEVIGGGVVKLERTQVICPACGQQVEAVASDGRVKGYCAVAKQHVDFLAETQCVPKGKHLTAETRAKISAAHKGKHHTAETRAKLSASLRRWHNRKGEDEGKL
ncbi:hypothetical protein ES703_111964 [subsurface metagenome]